jgi:hypothetical protein
MVSSGADGTAVRSVASVQGSGLFVAPDGRWLATGMGEELVLRGRALAPTGRDAPFVGPPGSWRAVAFADEGRALVATESSAGGQSRVEVETFAGHVQRSLGVAEAVAGDPQAAGVFAVAHSQPAASAPSGPGADTGAVSVLREDAGAPPVVLASSAQLLADLREPAGTPVILSVLPDPQGDKVAVEVVPTVDGRTGGMVVIGRNGRLLGTAPALPSGLGQPAWSPDGRTVVYDASTARRAAVEIWTIGRGPVLRAAPAGTPVGGAAPGTCLWNVGGTDFLCADSDDSGALATWLVGRSAGGGLRLSHGPSLPIVWLAG